MAKEKAEKAASIAVPWPSPSAIESVDDATLPASVRQPSIDPAARELAAAIIAGATDGHTAVGPVLAGLDKKAVTTIAARIKRLVVNVLRESNDQRTVSARVVSKADGLAWGIKLNAPKADAEAAAAE